MADKKIKPEETPDLKCSCGCSVFFVSVTDKKPAQGMCCDCRADVDLSGAVVRPV